MQYSIDQIKAHLSQPIKGLRVVESLTSTNDVLLQEAGELEAPHVLIAQEQTRGRGRRGHTWQSPAGSSLALSVLWRFDQAPKALLNLSVEVAQMIVRALETLGIHNCDVKWPNDILVEGRKLAGILIDAQHHLHCIDVVIGVGINIRDAQYLSHVHAIDLEKLRGERVDDNLLCARVIDALVQGCAEFPRQSSMVRYSAP